MTKSALASSEGDLEVVPVSKAVDCFGVSYLKFRLSLRPRWAAVVRDLSIGYFGLLLVLVAQFLVWSRWQSLAWLVAPLAGIALGVLLAYIQLFIHEAAHFGLAGSRRLNDALANVLIGPWAFTEIAQYRSVHWLHHRFLGTVNDPERSYFRPLGWAFLVDGVTGIAALRTISVRKHVPGTRRSGGTGAMRVALVRVLGCLYHSVIIVSCWIWAGPPAAISWIVGAFMIYPLLGSLRQLLEHRSPEASWSEDYAREPHGRYSRIFSGRLAGAVWGAAGFRWHALHHWDPDISYTNLPEVARFARNCPELAVLMPEARSYTQTFRMLFGAGK